MEYTDLFCESNRTADAVENYLDEQIASCEEQERPEITSCIEKATLRLTYGDTVNRQERATWDMQLMGFRDGFNKALTDI